MNFRDPKYNAFGTIDCEIEHPVYGWIPFTCDPTDKGAAFDTAALFAEMQPHAAPYVPPPPPTPEEIAAQQRAEAEANRQAAFQREADPLFFKWQAGEGTEADWLAKREEIRQRYPYPDSAE
jgi:hypothetical protein